MSAAPGSAGPPSCPEAKAQVLVVGTYHMANPGRDLVKVNIRDTLSAERQHEILQLAGMLAQFKPTKIALEALPENERVASAYRSFLAGGNDLSANENEQVGFRLGRDLGHPRLYGVDFHLGMDFDKLFSYAAGQNQQWFPDFLQRVTSSFGAWAEEVDQRFTVAQILAIYNSSRVLRTSHSVYLEMMKLGAGEDYPGVDVVADWYKRNMVIFSNIRRIIDSPADRVLVLYGQGHAKLLRDFIADSADLELVEASEYLSTPPEFQMPQI